MKTRDRLTLDLFEWEPEEVSVGYGDDVTGRGGLDNQISRLISRALRDAKDAGLTRAQVAKVVSDHLGRTVSKDMLDKWASESSVEHRIPLDAFTALVEATGARELLGFVPGRFGYVVVPERYASIIEIHLIEEKEKALAARKAALAAGWRRQG